MSPCLDLCTSLGALQPKYRLPCHLVSRQWRSGPSGPKSSSSRYFLDNQFRLCFGHRAWNLHQRWRVRYAITGLSSLITVTQGLTTVAGGHINPAITLAMCTLGKLPWRKLGVYWSGQFVGAFFGSLLVYGAYKGMDNACVASAVSD